MTEVNVDYTLYIAGVQSEGKVLYHKQCSISYESLKVIKVEIVHCCKREGRVGWSSRRRWKLGPNMHFIITGRVEEN